MRILYVLSFSIICCFFVNTSLSGDITAGRDLQIKDGILKTAAICNDFAQQVIPVESDEFRLAFDGLPVLTSKDFTVVSPLSGKQDSVNAAVYNLKSDQYGIAVSVSYSIDPKKQYLHKSLTITNQSQKSKVLRWLEVERLRIPGEYLEYSANPVFSNIKRLWSAGIVAFHLGWIGASCCEYRYGCFRNNFSAASSR